MRKANGIKITATKIKGMGAMPNFVYLGLRHLQKERPEGVHGEGSGVREYIIPVDLLRMTISPTLLTDVEEVRIAFKKTS